MRSLGWIACGVMLLQTSAPAQVSGAAIVAGEVPPSANKTTGSGSTASSRSVPEFVPMTRSERARYYLVHAFGPAAMLRAAASAGFSQAKGTPKEWGGGAEAFGDRLGDAYAKHVIREALEFGASTALHEDNRYVRSTGASFFKRTGHAVTSAFVARNQAGSEHFAYSRFGSVLGSAFISRLWQPRSENSPGDASVSFGVTMVTEMGWNFFKEFRPEISKRFRKH